MAGKKKRTRSKRQIRRGTCAAGGFSAEYETDFDDDIDMQIVYQVEPQDGEDVDHTLDTPCDALLYATCFLVALLLAIYVGGKI